MKIDFFELLDATFRGVVLFIYNVLDTLLWLTLRPLREPGRRYAAYRSSREKQVGPWTLLVLGFAALIVVMPAWFAKSNLDSAREDLPGLLLGEGGLGFFVRVLVAASAASIVLDAALRLLVLATRPRRPRFFRDFCVFTIEYALSLPILVLVLIFALASLAPDLSSSLATGVTGPALLAIAFYPAVRLSYRLLLTLPRGTVPAWAAGVAAYLVILAIVLAAAGGGLFADELLKSKQAGSTSVQVVRLTCAITPRGGTASVVLWNRTGAPQFPQDLFSTIQIRADGDAAGEHVADYALTFDPAPALSTGIDPGRTAALNATLRAKAAQAIPPAGRCLIGQPFVGQAEFRGSVTKAADTARP